MGGAHSHSGSDLGHVETARVPRTLLLGGLALAALATVIGVLALWPDADQPKAQYAAEGVTYPVAEVVGVRDPCPVIVVDPTAPQTGPPPVFPEKCDHVRVELASGERLDVQAEPGVVSSGLEAGDEVKLQAIPQQDGGTIYAYFGTVREFPYLVLTVFFVLAVALVARVRGVLALVGLGFAGLVLWRFMLPALLDGGSAVGVALAGSALIMFVVLYLAHGPSVRTSTALAGTLAGMGIIALIGEVAVLWARFSGVAGEGSERVRSFAADLDFRSLLICGVIVAGLGVLNDVTITQSSAVWELRAAGPELTRGELFVSGMRIGRDHIASTIYTIVFAYAGTSLMVLLLISMYDQSFRDLLTDEAIGEEIVRTLASGIGLVLAVPITTAIAAATVSGPTARAGTSAAPR
jgi:uncharacterized membrane protein